MLYGKVLYPPSFGATLASLDASAAEAMPGVKVVRDGRFRGGRGARSGHRGPSALAALKAEWKPVTAEASSRDVYEYFKQDRAGRRPPPKRELTSYTVAYIAHVPLEPRAAVAEWNGDKLTVWTGTQRPFGVRSELAAALRHSGGERARDRCRIPARATAASTTAMPRWKRRALAKAAGKPVKRNWTREEEMTWAYFRPGGVIEVGGQGRRRRHDHRVGVPQLQLGPIGAAIALRGPEPAGAVPPDEDAAAAGSYRGLAATANHFARESYMDELAHSIHMDPLEFRLKNAKNERLRDVILAAADKFGWKNRKKTAGRGFGIAAGFEKGGYVATCAEISVHRPARSRCCGWWRRSSAARW